MSDERHLLSKTMQAVEQLKEHLTGFLSADDGDDLEVIRDTLEGEIDLKGAIHLAVLRMQDDLALIEGINHRIDAMSKRKRRIEDRVAALRAMTLAAMQTGLQDTFEYPEAKITRKRTAPTALVLDESEIPSQFFQPQPPKLDKKGLLAALKDSDTPIPGAQLSESGETVQIKWS